MKTILLLALFVSVIASACIGTNETGSSTNETTANDTDMQIYSFDAVADDLQYIVDKEKEINQLMCNFYELDEKRSLGTAIILSEEPDENYEGHVDILIKTTERELEILNAVNERIAEINQKMSLIQKTEDEDLNENIESIIFEYSKYYSFVRSGVTEWSNGLEGVKRNLMIIREDPEQVDSIEDTQTSLRAGYTNFVNAEKRRSSIDAYLSVINRDLKEKQREVTPPASLNCLSPTSVS